MTALIIDTDPGVDDAFAIALAARDPGARLLGVTTVFGNVGVQATTRNALRVLALCGRDDVPVAAGADRPLVHERAQEADVVHGDDGLSGRSATLPEPSRGVAAVSAVGQMAAQLAAADEPVTIAAIGPLTNIALLLAAHPELKPSIGRVVIMGGALEGGNTTARAEFNVWSDPEAARRVLTDTGVRRVLVPMDLTYRCAVEPSWLDRLEASGPVGAALRPLSTVYLEHYTLALGHPAVVLHDAVAVIEAIRPGTLETRTFPLDVECGFGPSRGAVIADRRTPEAIASTVALEHGVPVEVAIDTDVDALRTTILAGLSR